MRRLVALVAVSLMVAACGDGGAGATTFPSSPPGLSTTAGHDPGSGSLSTEAVRDALGPGYWLQLDRTGVFSSPIGDDVREAVATDVAEFCDFIATRPDTWDEVNDYGNGIVDRRKRSAVTIREDLHSRYFGLLGAGMELACPEQEAYGRELSASANQAELTAMTESEKEALAVHMWASAMSGTQWPILPNEVFTVDEFLAQGEAVCNLVDLGATLDQALEDTMAEIAAAAPMANAMDQAFMSLAAINVGVFLRCPEHVGALSEWRPQIE